MKHIFFTALIFCSFTVLSQEIRMPDEARGKYVTEESQKDQSNASAEQARKAEMDRARKKREAQRGSSTSTTSQDELKEGTTSAVFCSIREIGTVEGNHGKVIIAVDPNIKKLGENLEPGKKKALYATLESSEYKSGLGALTTLSSSGWTLVETNMYSFEKTVVREYLLKLDLYR